MISAALKAIDSLKFDGPKNEADFDLAVRKYGMHGDGCDFQVAIYGAGFEATRNLTRDDLLTIREWIDVALMASAAKADAA
jgi:hypothetical protein